MLTPKLHKSSCHSFFDKGTVSAAMNTWSTAIELPNNATFGINDIVYCKDSFSIVEILRDCMDSSAIDIIVFLDGNSIIIETSHRVTR